jgi:hypothetical protein
MAQNKSEQSEKLFMILKSFLLIIIVNCFVYRNCQPKLLQKMKRFSFDYFLSNCISTKRLELINVGRSARAPFGCIRLYL